MDICNPKLQKRVLDTCLPYRFRDTATLQELKNDSFFVSHASSIISSKKPGMHWILPSIAQLSKKKKKQNSKSVRVTLTTFDKSTQGVNSVFWKSALYGESPQDDQQHTQTKPGIHGNTAKHKEICMIMESLKLLRIESITVISLT